MLAFYLSLLETEEEKLTLTDLYEQHMYTCYYTALKITQNREMAEDAVHNAFIAIIKHKDEIFRLPCGKRRSRIVIIAKNKAIDLLRAAKAHSAVPLDEGAASGADELNLGDYVANQEGYQRLLDCIAALPDLYKTAFELRYVHDMTNMEIGALLNASPKTISMRIARAKDLLRQLLDKEAALHG